MQDRPFVDPATAPTDDAIRAALGRAFGWYDELLGRATGFRRAWNYSKGSGWMLKVDDGKKALLYVIPLLDAFRVSMAVREPEREVLLADGGLAVVRPALAAARKAPEGFACYFDVASLADLQAVDLLVSRLVELRRA